MTNTTNIRHGSLASSRYESYACTHGAVLWSAVAWLMCAVLRCAVLCCAVRRHLRLHPHATAVRLQCVVWWLAANILWVRAWLHCVCVLLHD